MGKRNKPGFSWIIFYIMGMLLYFSGVCFYIIKISLWINTAIKYMQSFDGRDQGNNHRLLIFGLNIHFIFQYVSYFTCSEFVIKKPFFNGPKPDGNHPKLSIRACSKICLRKFCKTANNI